MSKEKINFPIQDKICRILPAQETHLGAWDLDSQEILRPQRTDSAAEAGKRPRNIRRLSGEERRRRRRRDLERLQQRPMNAQVVRQLRMERAGEPTAFANQDGFAFDARQNLNVGPQAGDPWSTDKNAFHANPFRVGIGVRGRDERIELGAISISLGFKIHQPKCWNRMVVGRLRQDDRPSTGSKKCAARFGEFLDRLDEIKASESLRDRRALSARQNQAAEARQVARREHSLPSSAEAFESSQVFFDVPLDSKDTDHRRRVRHG